MASKQCYIKFGTYFLTYYSKGVFRLNRGWKDRTLQQWIVTYDEKVGAHTISSLNHKTNIAVASGRNPNSYEVLVMEDPSANNPNKYWIIDSDNTIKLQSDKKFFWNMEHRKDLEREPIQLNKSDDDIVDIPKFELVEI